MHVGYVIFDMSGEPAKKAYKYKILGRDHKTSLIRNNIRSRPTYDLSDDLVNWKTA